MAQNWTNDSFALNHVGTTDLQNMEDNFMTLKSMFSGSSSPDSIPGMPWFDTTNKILKIKNAANSAWLGVMYGNSDTKIWVYSNTAGDGWTIHSALTDRVLAIKGGSAAYDISGGSAAGDWTYNHTHTFTSSEDGEHVHKIRDQRDDETDRVYDLDGNLVNITRSSSQADIGVEISNGIYNPPTETKTRYYDPKHWYSALEPNHSHTGPTDVSTDDTWRPAAAVGTLQYPNA